MVSVHYESEGRRYVDERDLLTPRVHVGMVH